MRLWTFEENRLAYGFQKGEAPAELDRAINPARQEPRTPFLIDGRRGNSGRLWAITIGRGFTIFFGSGGF
jgi:hypothetical protein